MSGCSTIRHTLLIGVFLLPLATAAVFTAPAQDPPDPLNIANVTPEQAGQRSEGCISFGCGHR